MRQMKLKNRELRDILPFSKIILILNEADSIDILDEQTK